MSIKSIILSCAAIASLCLPMQGSAQSPTCVTMLVLLDSVRYPGQPATRVTVPCPAIVHDTVLKTIHDTIYAPAPIVVPPIVPAFSGAAELPRVFLNTAAPAAPDVGGTVIRVAAGGNLQAALDAAQPGDVVELAAGSVFTGNFVFKAKVASTKWITVRPSNYASLPAEGSRLTPTIATALALPRIQTSSVSPALGFAAGANHVRITGVEIGLAPTNRRTYALVNMESTTGQKTLTEIPSFLTLDRVFIHGNAADTVRRCVAMNSASSAVIDSYLSDCHEKGSDSQAIAIWNGPGPFKIVNDYLEAAGENIIIGGNDPSISGLVPSDIEMRRNHFFKQPSWKGLWTVKNLLETKNAQRVLIEGNVLENSWTSGQNGLGVGFKSSNQNGTCTWCVTQDVTYRLNVLRNVGAAYNVGASPDNAYQTIHAQRISITDNVATNINTSTQFDGDGRAFLLDGDLRDVLIAHNTTLTETHGVVLGGAPSVSLTIRDNVFGTRIYALLGTNYSGGAAWTHFAPTGTFTKNLFIADPLISSANFGTLTGYPPGNWFASGYVSAFPSYGAGDFTSTYVQLGTDGRPLGANIAAVNAATAGVIIP